MKILFTIALSCCLLTTYAQASTTTKPETDATEASQIPIAAKTEPVQKKAKVSTGSTGKMLYENHCTNCHASTAHIRDHRKAQNIRDVKIWVTRWQSHEQLKWDDDAINDVTEYLVDRYYKFK